MTARDALGPMPSPRADGPRDPPVHGRVLGWSSGVDAFDLVLAGDDLYVLRVGSAPAPSRPSLGPVITVLHWAASLYAKVGARGLVRDVGMTDLGPLTREHARTRMRRENVPPGGWLALDPANRSLALSGATFRKLPAESDDDVVQVRGRFVSAREPEGRVEVRRFAATGDPVRALERLLAKAGVHVG